MGFFLLRKNNGQAAAGTGYSVTQNQTKHSILVNDKDNLELSSILNKTGTKNVGLRIFISNVNSILGHSLFEELRNDHIAIHSGEPAHRFYGTVNQRDLEAGVQIPGSQEGQIKIINSMI